MGHRHAHPSIPALAGTPGLHALWWLMVNQGERLVSAFNGFISLLGKHKQESNKKLSFLESKATESSCSTFVSRSIFTATQTACPFVSACDVPQLALAVFLSGSWLVSCLVSQQFLQIPQKPVQLDAGWSTQMESVQQNRPSNPVSCLQPCSQSAFLLPSLICAYPHQLSGPRVSPSAT